MDSFELNKILGAILGTLLFVMGIGFLAEAIYVPRHSGPGFELPAPTEETASGPAAPAAVVDIGTLLASADAKQGAASAKKCQACHDFTKGGPNKTGPNLYDVVERKIASEPGFTYSAGLSALNTETWTYEHLNTWLISPKAMVPDTKMGFAGIKDDAERANVIAFLATLSDSPKPYPAPAPAQGGEAPASGQVESGVSSEAAPASQPATDTVPASSSEAAPASSAAAAPEASGAASSSAAQ